MCLRAPGVFDEATYAVIRAGRAEDPAFEWSPIWEYGAFLDVRDLATAIASALVADLDGHHRVLVCADDISSAAEDSLTLAGRLMPTVPVTQPERYARAPFAALVDSTPAQHLLGWRPEHRWR